METVPDKMDSLEVREHPMEHQEMDATAQSSPRYPGTVQSLSSDDFVATPLSLRNSPNINMTGLGSAQGHSELTLGQWGGMFQMVTANSEIRVDGNTLDIPGLVAVSM
jgi:hypothetical protein